jgi:hypothetical protein
VCSFLFCFTFCGDIVSDAVGTAHVRSLYLLGNISKQDRSRLPCCVVVTQPSDLIPNLVSILTWNAARFSVKDLVDDERI